MATVADFMREWDAPDEYVTAHTSGSTGTPKTIRLLKSDMRVSARATNTFFGIGAGSVLGLPLSVDYIAGKMMAVRAHEAGCRLVELPVSNEITVPESIDLLAVVPSQIPSLLLSGTADRVRHLLVGGAPLSAEAAGALTDCGVDAWLGYGMTETCSHVALRRIADDDNLYHAMPGISFSVDGNGCLTIESERFSWHRLVTRDVVELQSPQTFRWLGRADNVINSGGIKIHPESLEAEIRGALPWLPSFYIVGEPDARWGSRPVMVAEGPIDIALVKSVLRDRRTAPARVVVVGTLPTTSNGKLLRRLPE